MRIKNDNIDKKKLNLQFTRSIINFDLIDLTAIILFRIEISNFKKYKY